MKNFLQNNIGLVTMRQYAYDVPSYCYVFVTDSMIDNRTFISNKGIVSLFPLYTYSDDMLGTRQPNLDAKIFAAIQQAIPHVTPESLFDYIYAVLHSPAYRARYAEFLKSDFPRIPHPRDARKVLTGWRC